MQKLSEKINETLLLYAEGNKIDVLLHEKVVQKSNATDITCQQKCKIVK